MPILKSFLFLFIDPCPAGGGYRHFIVFVAVFFSQTIDWSKE
jgi:hypothetical protein